MDLSITLATAADIEAITSLRSDVASALTRIHGRGHWSRAVTPRAVARALGASHVLVARDGDVVSGTLCLATKKPWAIDPAYFEPVKRPLYLVDMAVAPDRQRCGIGRRLIAAAQAATRAWPAQAIRLDAYDTPAGAGGFYEACGFQEVGRVTYRGVPLIYYEWRA